jgi:hypothetical protein
LLLRVLERARSISRFRFGMGIDDGRLTVEMDGAKIGSGTEGWQFGMAGFEEGYTMGDLYDREADQRHGFTTSAAV